MIYWDHNATSPLRPRVKEKMVEALELYHANPNSSHGLGQKARSVIEDSRRVLAEALGCEPIELVFTSTATEANWLALWGLWLARSQTNPRLKKILSSPIEHGSVFENLQFLAEKWGAEIVYTPLRKEEIDLEAVEKILKKDSESFAFATVMGGHNESGIIPPWKEMAQLSQHFGIPFHSDLVQCFAKVPIDLKTSGVSTATIAFHKIGGPKGVGVLYIRKGTLCESIIRGGGQEKKRRAGTENLITIVGAKAAAEEKLSLEGIFGTRVENIRNEFESRLLRTVLPSATVVGKNVARLPNTSYIIFPLGMRSDAMLLHLDMRGVCVSSGSACSSGMVIPSRALLQLGYSEEQAISAIRFSLGPENTEEEMKFVLEQIDAAAKKMVA